jgi:hypothetical protein
MGSLWKLAMFRIVEPLGGRFTAPAAGGGGAAAFNPASVTGYSRDWNFADITKIYTDTAGTILATTDGDPIGAILCSAGSTIKLAAPADASRPTYETGIQNGLSVGRFDGSDDYLTHATAIDADASQTLYIVLAKASAPGIGTRNALAFAANSHVMADSDIGTGWNYNVNAAAASVAGPGTVTNWTIATLKFTDATSAAIYSNGGAPVTFDPNNGYSTATALFIGANQAAAGDIDIDVGRILVYSAVHTTTEMDYVLSGLGALWGISVTATS